MIVMMLSLFACVGTVKDQNTPESNVSSSQGNSIPISFEGLARVTPISNTKIELFFYEAVTAADEVVYEIYVNNSAVPIKLSSKSVPRVSGGLLLFTVPNLETNTTYSFNMRAVPAGMASNVSLDASKTLFATTFNNETSDFLGITSATTLSGVDGKSKIFVKWVAAKDDGLDDLTSTNPYQYEISYITETGGVANINNPGLTAPTRNVKIISASNSEFKNTGGIVVDGLSAGTKYYFQVRAIHFGWNKYSLILPNYKREQNSKYAYATTLSDASTMVFDRPQLALTNPVGAIGLSTIDTNWNAATGVFNNYYICYVNNETTADLINISSNTTMASLVGAASGTACISVEASKTYYRIPNLTQYATYQVKIVACKTSDCDGANRVISSELVTKKVETPVAQFNGIASIVDPISYTDASDLKKITLNYSPPVRNTGYITKLVVKCHNGASDLTGVNIPLPGNGSASSPGHTCHGLTQDSTTIPDEVTGNSTDIAFYASSVKSTVIQLASDINNSTEYCFSITPQITGPGATVVEGQRIIKCTIPKISTPTIFDFPGKTLGCQIQNGKDLQVVWPKSKQNPGGLLSGYLVFWKEKANSTDYFNFPNAKSAYASSGYAANAPNGSTYNWQKIADKDTISTVLNTLSAGKTYSIGVLPYLSTATLNLFGQDNFNVDDCAIPLPKAKFNEWVDIFAIGPKEDGLTPGHNNYFLETLDDDGIPVEVALTPNDSTYAPVDTNKRGGVLFDGIYGSKDDAKTGNYNQYSNSGIIRIGWKEVTLSVADTINTYYTAAGGDVKVDNVTPAEKPDRKYGYRVYRSSDNQKTWVNLTAANSTSNINYYQSSANAGLIHSESKTTKERNNAPDITENIATFTDYSVRYSDSNGDVDRARVYYYKIVPVYNGKELVYEDNTNPTHHILRVTLPPRNMALVHRLMANRTLCLELNSATHPRTLNKTTSGYYSCEYDGIGAKSLSTPWAVGATVIDQGGDLLIDRYELSCPFSRGTPVNSGDYASSTAPVGVDLLTFDGTSAGGSYKGCYNPNSNVQYDPGRGTIDGSSQASYDKVLPGDCFGSDLPLVASTAKSSSVCALGNSLTSKFPYYYPGTPITDPNFELDCTVAGNNTGPTYTDFFNSYGITSLINTKDAAPTQSEFGAVYYMRTAYKMHDTSYVPPRLIGGQKDNTKAFPGALTYSTTTRQNACMVNLPYKNSNGYWRPRWISLNSLFGRLQYQNDPASATPDETNIDIHNKTINDITSDSRFYNSSIGTSVPDNITTSLSSRKINPSTTPLARIATSNSAKLPPLSGLSQIMLQQICNSYTVEVGIDSSSGSDTSAFKAVESKTKRLLRRTEHITSAAWPATYDETTVTDLETGINNHPATPNTSCNTIDRTPKNGDDLYSFGDSFSPLFPHYKRSTHAPFMTGSSSTSGDDSSEKCVSRFGVQDLVGNMQEFMGDQLFCDTSDLKMKQNNLTTTVDRSYWSDMASANNMIKVPSTDTSGKCSLVDTNEDNNVYISGNIMRDIYTFLGSLSDFIKNPKNSDQESILTARNGNGYFLNFGQNKMAMPLTDANAINYTNPSSYYFNPIFGIPLTCANSTTCDGDNKRYGISGYTDINNSSNYYNTNFPINNSALANDALKAIAQGTGSNTSHGVDPLHPVTIYSNDYTGVTYNATTADSHPYLNIVWAVDRDDGSAETIATMQLYSGGSINDPAGRYSMTIKGRRDEYQTRSNETNSDGRCATLINQN